MLLILTYSEGTGSLTGARSPQIASRQSLWLAEMWHAYWAAGS